MRERGFGRIINISSINGQKGQMGQANYSAAKAGDIGFTKALAQEGADKGITVNAIAPGYIATEMVQAVPQEFSKRTILPQIPVGRLGKPEEIARCRGVPRCRRRRLHHRLDADHQRRAIYGLRRTPKGIATMLGAKNLLAMLALALALAVIFFSGRYYASLRPEKMDLGEISLALEREAEELNATLPEMVSGMSGSIRRRRGRATPSPISTPSSTTTKPTRSPPTLERQISSKLSFSNASAR